MLIDDLLSLLDTANLGTPETDLFAGALPPSPDTVTVLTEYGGVAPTMVQGQALPVIEYPRVQIRTRGAAYDYEAARLRIERVYQFLVARQHETVSGGARYMAWLPVQTPFPIGQDDNHRWIFAVNVEVWKEVSSLS